MRRDRILHTDVTRWVVSVHSSDEVEDTGPARPPVSAYGQPNKRAPLDLMPLTWHDRSMARVRVSTTVDQSLIDRARQVRSDLNDARLLDQALSALLAQHRTAEIDAAYEAYDLHPLDEADEWGDLASFREAATSP